MLRVINNRGIENAIKDWKSKSAKANLMEELKDLRYYTSPSLAKKEKLNKAKYHQEWIRKHQA